MNPIIKWKDSLSLSLSAKNEMTRFFIKLLFKKKVNFKMQKQKGSSPCCSKKWMDGVLFTKLATLSQKNLNSFKKNMDDFSNIFMIIIQVKPAYSCTIQHESKNTQLMGDNYNL